MRFVFSSLIFRKMLRYAAEWDISAGKQNTAAGPFGFVSLLIAGVVWIIGKEQTFRVEAQVP